MNRKGGVNAIFVEYKWWRGNSVVGFLMYQPSYKGNMLNLEKLDRDKQDNII